jgi:hypothetical protein
MLLAIWVFLEKKDLKLLMDNNGTEPAWRNIIIIGSDVQR